MGVAQPYLESIKKINEWYDQGHYICFVTARTEEHREVTLEWLGKNGVKFHQLILGKPRRNRGDEYHYIDDTPVRRRGTRCLRELSQEDEGCSSFRERLVSEH